MLVEMLCLRRENLKMWKQDEESQTNQMETFVVFGSGMVQTRESEKGRSLILHKTITL